MILPPHAYLEITRQCNQRCPFCSCVWLEQADSPQSEMSLDEWKDAAEELIANGVRYLAVTGGEPTLKPGARELFRHIAELLKRRYKDDGLLALFTNGKCVSEEWLELLKECRGELYTSLPGLASYAAQTGEQYGDFRRILKFVHKASERGIRTSVGVTVTKANLQELYEIFSYLVLSGANAVILNLFKPSGRGNVHPELVLAKEDILLAAQTAEEVASQCCGVASFGGEFPPFVRQEDYPHIQIENCCVAAKGTFTIAPDGWIHVCEHDGEGICHWRHWRTLEASPRWRHFAKCSQAVCPLFDADDIC